MRFSLVLKLTSTRLHQKDELRSNACADPPPHKQFNWSFTHRLRLVSLLTCSCSAFFNRAAFHGWSSRVAKEDHHMLKSSPVENSSDYIGSKATSVSVWTFHRLTTISLFWSISVLIGSCAPHPFRRSFSMFSTPNSAAVKRALCSKWWSSQRWSRRQATIYETNG